MKELKKKQQQLGVDKYTTVLCVNVPVVYISILLEYYGLCNVLDVGVSQTARNNSQDGYASRYARYAR